MISRLMPVPGWVKVLRKLVSPDSGLVTSTVNWLRLGWNSIFLVIGTLHRQAGFVGGQAGDFHRGVGPRQFDSAVGHHLLRTVELAGGREVQGNLVTGLHAIGLGAGGADVENHIQHVLGPQGLFDLGHVGGLGVGRRGREDLHRHRAGIGIAGATGKRQQQQDKHSGVHLVILLQAYRLL
nr:hypothetical protein GCM10020185_62130 [Pseudomonas brassicacearum subsp. brassicacearum]